MFRQAWVDQRPHGLLLYTCLTLTGLHAEGRGARGRVSCKPTDSDYTWRRQSRMQKTPSASCAGPT